MQRKLGEVIAPVSRRENLEDYLEVLQPSELDFPAIAADWEKLLALIVTFIYALVIIIFYLCR